MNNYNKLINNLDTLGLNKFVEHLDNYIEYINNGSKTLIDALYELSEYECNMRIERAMNACVKVANFPFLKTFEDFNFNFQPSINKEQILNFRYLKFIENRENIIFIGSPGVGKTHLATSIGIEAAKSRVSTYFISCGDLLLQLKRAHLENRLEQRIKFFSKYKLLIIDEVGFLPLDIESSNLLFQLIAKRYEKNSTIVTTNKPLSRWGEIFGDPVLANAILDRLLHHSNVINIVGRSYRTKDIIEDDN
ncbi:MAG: IS21-like element helper ATPase IstB [Candidatus Coprovivens sp.]